MSKKSSLKKSASTSKPVVKGKPDPKAKLSAAKVKPMAIKATKKPTPPAKVAPKATAKPVVATKLVVKTPTAAKAVPPTKVAPTSKVAATTKSVPVTKVAPAPKGGKVVTKSVELIVAGKKGAKVAVPAGKGAKKASKVDHAEQKKALDKHRVTHEQIPMVVPVRAKLQYFTVADVMAYLNSRKREGAKLNLWVPEEERKAREKAATAARDKSHKSHNIAAASIADLLGGVNPFRKGGGFMDESKQIPEKLRRYYHLLTAMREVIQKGLAFHSEEALKKNGKDDSGDLSGYSQHLADAGTDTADRDFALSLISNEQEALKEIADSIERLKTNKYGICEITGKAIPHARLMAVPFTRYSLEGQKELERNRRAHRRRGNNPLGEIGDEVGFGTGGGGGEEDQPES